MTAPADGILNPRLRKAATVSSKQSKTNRIKMKRILYLISAYLLIGMFKNGASSKVIGKMIGNITLDAVVGAIPFLGTVFDFMFKANKRNLTLAIEHFEEGKHQGSILPYLIPIIIILIALFAFVVYITIIAFRFFFDILNQIQL